MTDQKINLDQPKINGNFVILREKSIYTSFYCEENVWHLCKWVADNYPQFLDDCRVVFISNEIRCIPMWYQKIGNSDKEGYVCWDYHVIFLHSIKVSEPGTNGDQIKIKTMVYDFDTVLSFPCLFCEYISTVIRIETSLKPEFERKFRVIPAKLFLQQFASNRSHMVETNGDWSKPPPNYPPINFPGCEDNLQSFISMNPSIGIGEVMEKDEFFQRFKQ